MAKLFRVVVTECVKTEFFVEADDEDEIREIVEDDDFDLNALEIDSDAYVEEVEVGACDPSENSADVCLKDGELCRRVD